MANRARQAIKAALEIPRYKIVANVIVGQDSGQDFTYTSRCLWYPQTDNFVQSQIKVGDLFAVVTVFAVYHE